MKAKPTVPRLNVRNVGKNKINRFGEARDANLTKVTERSKPELEQSSATSRHKPERRLDFEKEESEMKNQIQELKRKLNMTQ